MRSRWYVIEVYDTELQDRCIVYETDYGVLAWLEWWKIKLSKYNYAYPIITIRG